MNEDEVGEGEKQNSKNIEKSSGGVGVFFCVKQLL